MKGIKTPQHSYPIQHVAISASQNVLKSYASSVKKDAKGLVYYVKKGLMPSLKFARTADLIRDGYDENKAMFPVYGNVPLFVPTTIAAIESGKKVSVIGSREVGDVVNRLRAYYFEINESAKAQSLKWVPEYDGMEGSMEDAREVIASKRKKLTLNNSMKRVAASLKKGKNDSFLFVTGDIIFYDYNRAAHDTDSIDNSLIMDLNGREVINPPFPRNYYHCMQTREGKKVFFKEPNVWTLGPEFNLGFSDRTYGSAQKGGFGAGAFMRMATKNILRYLFDFEMKDALSAARCFTRAGRHYLSKFEVMANLRENVYIPVYPQEDMERLGSFLSMAPVRVKAEHDDWMRLKDVDAMHDYTFIRRLMEEHIDDIFPERIAQRIKGFNTRIQCPIPDLADRVNDKVDRVQHALKKMKIDFIIPKPFTDIGLFVAQPRPDESLEQAVEDSRRYLEGYYERAPSYDDVSARNQTRKTTNPASQLTHPERTRIKDKVIK